MKKATIKFIQKFWNIFSTLFVLSALILSTIAVVFYSKGYRFNLRDAIVEETGVISISSDPSRSEVFIDGKSIGRTPKSMSSIKPGISTVKVTRDEYRDWEKEVPVRSQHSTPISADLFLQTTISQSMFSTEEQIVEQIRDHFGNYIFIVTKTEIGEEEDNYKIYRYKTNTNFWNLNSETTEIFNSNISREIEKLSYRPSYDGEYLLIIANPIAEKPELKTSYLAKTDGTPENVFQPELSDFYTDYTFYWAKDSTHLVMESSADIISYNIENGQKSLLLKKNLNADNKAYIWNTDEEGSFYFTRYTKGDLVTKLDPYYSLYQIELNGSNEEVVIEKIFYRDDNLFIKEIENKVEFAVPFTNSPQNTRFAGEIKNFIVNQTAKGVVMETEFALYWYDLETKKYILINPYKSKLITFSPDVRKVMFINEANNKLGIFTFEKDDGDHVTELGTKFIRNSTDITPESLNWLSNSKWVAYTVKSEEGYEVRVIDTDGFNEYSLVEMSNNFYVFDGRFKNVYTVDSESKGVVRFQVR